MKRSPMPRATKPLARTTRIKARRSTVRKSGRVHDAGYLARVRELPCYVCSRPGPSDPDHMGAHPYGRKADDDTCVPMCRDCHRRRTDGFLPVALATAGFGYPRWERANKAVMRAWCNNAIAATRAAVARRAAGGVPW